jgi:hypothetical protein
MYYKLICILYALLCGQNFILVKSGCYSLGKPNCPVFQTRLYGFGRTKDILSEEDDCSTSSSDVDDDDDTYDEYDEQELLVEFKKFISKHMKL